MLKSLKLRLGFGSWSFRANIKRPHLNQTWHARASNTEEHHKCQSICVFRRRGNASASLTKDADKGAPQLLHEPLRLFDVDVVA